MESEKFPSADEAKLVSENSSSKRNPSSENVDCIRKYSNSSKDEKKDIENDGKSGTHSTLPVERSTSINYAGMKEVNKLNPDDKTPPTNASKQRCDATNDKSSKEPIDIVFCFDTTGSMSRVTDVVKANVTELTQRLIQDIPGIRIGILAHGDYGDEPYLLQRLDLTKSRSQLRRFIGEVQDTGGGDEPECYELALHEVRTNFSWRPNTRKRLVIIGDDEPHDINSPRNLRKIDWRKEVERLRDELNLVIYSVQALGHSQHLWFWKGMADMTGGKHLELMNFSSIFEFLMGICYYEKGPEHFRAFAREVCSRSSSDSHHHERNLSDYRRQVTKPARSHLSEDVERMFSSFDPSFSYDAEEEDIGVKSPKHTAKSESAKRLKISGRTRVAVARETSQLDPDTVTPSKIRALVRQLLDMEKDSNNSDPENI